MVYGAGRPDRRRGIAATGSDWKYGLDERFEGFLQERSTLSLGETGDSGGQSCCFILALPIPCIVSGQCKSNNSNNSNGSD